MKARGVEGDTICLAIAKQVDARCKSTLSDLFWAAREYREPLVEITIDNQHNCWAYGTHTHIYMYISHYSWQVDGVNKQTNTSRGHHVLGVKKERQTFGDSKPKQMAILKHKRPEFHTTKLACQQKFTSTIVNMSNIIENNTLVQLGSVDFGKQQWLSNDSNGYFEKMGIIMMVTRQKLLDLAPKFGQPWSRLHQETPTLRSWYSHVLPYLVAQSS